MELGAESVDMHDAGRFVGGDGNEFEKVPGGIWSDHEESLFAVVLVLDVPESVLPGMGDGDIVNSVFASGRRDLHTRKPYIYAQRSSRSGLRILEVCSAPIATR